MSNTKIRLILFFAAENGEALYSQQKQDQMLTVAQINELLTENFKLKLKKVGKTTTPLRCDLNQIPYDYIVEVTNRLKGLDLIDRVHEKQWQEVPDIVQKAVMMTIPKKKTCKKAKCLSEEALQIAKNSKRQRRKGKTSICMQSFKEQQGKIRKPY